MAGNVLGTQLKSCCLDPVTGFYRNGVCDTGFEDKGMHIVCARVTQDFLEFARSCGNDLISPAPEYNFPGLQEGDQWCVCLGTVLEAIKAGKAPQIILEATHISALEFVDLEVLQMYAVDSLRG
ncbi:MAG: DUF2237 domain-containing protein [Phycisphaeraceae bacterium]|nr:DUF2237 domain-containing protein [Phycisphaeraceae bacterium]